jgi:hypothetical protein
MGPFHVADCPQGAEGQKGEYANCRYIRFRHMEIAITHTDATAAWWCLDTFENDRLT